MTSICVVADSQGVKEVTLLGQNVNSYRDTSEEQFCGSDLTQLSRGFKTVYRTKQGGLRFSDLLDAASRINPDMRIRFTSPHPKDFPDEVRFFNFEKTVAEKNILGITQSHDSIVMIPNYQVR